MLLHVFRNSPSLLMNKALQYLNWLHSPWKDNQPLPLPQIWRCWPTSQPLHSQLHFYAWWMWNGWIICHVILKHYFANNTILYEIQQPIFNCLRGLSIVRVHWKDYWLQMSHSWQLNTFAVRSLYFSFYSRVLFRCWWGVVRWKAFSRPILVCGLDGLWAALKARLAGQCNGPRLFTSGHRADEHSEICWLVLHYSHSSLYCMHSHSVTLAQLSAVACLYLHFSLLTFSQILPDQVTDREQCYPATITD